MKLVLISRADGGASLMQTTADEVAAEVAKWEAAAPPEWLPATWQEITAGQVLASRRFRNAWRFAFGQLRVALSPARLQILAEVRRERNRRLLESDADRHRLAEIGTDLQRADLAAYRQQLRDLPAVVQAEIEVITTAAGLEAYQPTWPAKPA